MPVYKKRSALLWIAIIITSLFLTIPTSRVLGKALADRTAYKTLLSPALSETIEAQEAIASHLDAHSNNAGEMKSEGFSVATLAIVIMVATLLFVGVTYGRGISALPRFFKADWLQYALPVLCVVGLIVAGYLSYVEIFVVEAVCGPVGDCNAVQSSIYAKLFGILPIGVLGMGGYVAIFCAWLYPRKRNDRLAHYAPLANFCMALFGVIFSIYLTYLEIFVIRAVCMWCVSSAIIMDLLLLVTLGPALQAMDEDGEDD